MPLRRLIVPIIDAHPSCDAPRQKRRRMAPMERSCLRGMTSNDDLGLLKKALGQHGPRPFRCDPFIHDVKEHAQRPKAFSDNALAR